MSSRHKKSSHRTGVYPTGWTEWEWSEQYQRKYRARETSKGAWEYEYAQPIDAQGLTPTPFIPRDRGTDPHAALPRPDERSQLYAEPGGVQSEYYGESSFSTGPLGSTRDGQLYTTSDSISAETDRFGRMTLDFEVGVQDVHQGLSDSSYTSASKKNNRNGKGILCPICSTTFSQSSDLERHHKTVHVNEGARPYQCHVDGCPANVRSWTNEAKLHIHEKTWHSGESDADTSQTRQSFQLSSQPEPNPYEEASNASANQEQPYFLPPNSHSPQLAYQQSPPAQQTRNIRTKNPKVKYDDLDARFKIHKSSEFKFGRVFKVLWSEPIGSGGTEITVDAKYGERAFHKIRRFMIVNSKKGYSICIPILTYGSQGVLKNGVDPHDHAAVYSSRRDGPNILDRERGLMTKKSIRIEVKDPSQALDPMSRLNYGKTYTVEHNVKILFIGKVAENYEQAVVVAFNDTHPPLSSRPYPERPDSPDAYTMGAQMSDSIYPSASSIPPSSASYPGYPIPPTYGSPVSQPYGISYPANPAIPTSYTATNYDQPTDYDQPTTTYQDAY